MPKTAIVVAAMIVEHGRLLATRRTAPSDLAGGWELPGGKVDPGETPEVALVREVHEELGCTVQVGPRVPGAESLRPGLALHAYECWLVDGEVVPREHDAVRWLASEDLDDVPWLPGDLPFVDTLRERLLDGEALQGGNVGGAIRIGPTVRRPTGPWTPAVHRLLRHLEAAGLDGIPRVLGFDARGREVLTHLPGRTVAVDGEEPSTETLRDAARWLRRFHTAVTTFRPVGTLSWRHGARALAPAEIICHNDPGVYNWIVSDGRFAGIIDWDIAGPGVPLEDLAFLAWTGVPLSHEMSTPDVVRRLRLVADAYGGVDPRLLLHAAGTRMASAAERIAAGQDTGDPGMLALRDLGEPERTRQRVADLRRRVPVIEAALADSP